MHRSLFLRIVNAVKSDTYFQQHEEAIGRADFTPIQKYTVAIRQLATGGATDSYDKYLRIIESTSLLCLRKFCRAIVSIFGAEYLRRSTTTDCRSLLAMHKHDFPGMLKSLDCMHWTWKTYPTAWQGACTRGDHGEPTIILEAVASQDLWIWHLFFGVPGSNNDMNVLNQSSLFNDVLWGTTPSVQFEANGSHFTMGYYLTDDIYPNWPAFVKALLFHSDEKKMRFKLMQEAARKNIERAFDVLQARWAIIRGSTRLWKKEHLSDMMFACIILHNMIIEDEGKYATEWEDEGNNEASSSTSQPQNHRRAPPEFCAYLARDSTLHDKRMHARLQDELIEHIWARFGLTQP